MAWQVTVNSGLKEVVLPDGLRYQGGAVVVLDDAQYGSLSANAVATLFSSASQMGAGEVNAGTGLTKTGSTIGVTPSTYDAYGAASTAQSNAEAYSSPTTTLGDTIYGGASGVPTRLAPNTTTTRKFWRQVGNGSASAAPAWDTLQVGDLPAGSGLTAFAPVASNDTSGATDGPAVQGLINALATFGGGRVVHAAGTYWGSLTLKTGVYLEGAGVGATSWNLPAGANTDVIGGLNFSSLTLTGASSWGSSGIYNCGVRGMTIDGNASNQTGASFGIRWYGYQWTLADLDVRNCYTDGLWTEWGALGSNAPVTSDGSEATASNVRAHHNGRHGWSMLGPSDARMNNVLCFENNQSAGAAGIGLWALDDPISCTCLTASGMNATNASGFTGTFTVQAATMGNPTDLFASSGTLSVVTSTGTATMTYTGKTATTFTGCTVTSGSGTFQTGNAVQSATQRFTANGLQLSNCHVWAINHTWATVWDAQVTDVGGHFEGGQYGQLLIRASANKAGGMVYDFTPIASGCGIQLGDNGSTPGVPMSAPLTANAVDLRTRTQDFVGDTTARSSLNWVSATQSSVDLLAVASQIGVFSTTIASGSNGVDLSTFTGGSPGTLHVANTQSIPNGAGSVLVATAKGNVTCTFTGTNGSNVTRAAGTQLTGVVATGTSGSGYTMSTGGAVSLLNVGTVAVGGSPDASSRIRVSASGSTEAQVTGPSMVQEFGPHTTDIGTGTFVVKANGTTLLNLNGSTGKFTALPRYNTAPASVSPTDPASTTSTSLVMMGLGSSCTYTPTGSGIVLVVFTGPVNANNSGGWSFYEPKYGTGTAPAHGAAATGSGWGGADGYSQISTPGIIAVTAVLTLTANTTYWFDMAISAPSGTEPTSLTNVSYTFAEL